MNKVINYGIIGFGSYAERRLLPAFSRTPSCRLVAICRRSAVRGREQSAQYGIPYFFKHPADLVASPEIEAVIVTSPPAFHREHVLLAARAGKHVLVEKPIAVRAEEVEEMIRVCSENGVLLMAGFVMRFLESVIKARQIVQAETLGRLGYAGGYFGLNAELSQRRWLQDPQISGGGPVADLGSHFIDLLQFITGKSITGVQAMVRPEFTAQHIEQNAVINLEFDGLLLGSLYTSFSVIRESGLTFHGSQGKLSLKNFNQPDTTVYLELLTDEKNQTIPVMNGNPYSRMLEHLSQSILTGAPLLTPGETGLQNQRIIDWIYGR